MKAKDWRLEHKRYEVWTLGKRKLHVYWPPAPHRGLAWDNLKRDHYPHMVSQRELEEYGWRKRALVTEALGPQSPGPVNERQSQSRHVD